MNPPLLQHFDLMNYYETVQRWLELKAAIARLTLEERSLRQGLFSGTFPSPKEGANTVEFPDGSKLKGTHVLNRSLVEGWERKLHDDLKKVVVRTKHELDVTMYKKLPDEERALVDKVIVTKPGMPKLEFIPAKED